MSTIPDDLMSSYTYDVVAVTDPDTGLQLFDGAEIMKANVGPLSKIMDHPLEDGTPVSDFKIDLPVTIDLAMLIDSMQVTGVYQQIDLARRSATLLTVRTNADTYDNLIIEGLPHDELPEMFGMLALSLRLREVQLVTLQYQALTSNDVADQTAQSTVTTGETQPQQSNSVLYDATSGFR